MPIYEYRCEKCDVVSDVKHAYKEQIELTCPNCGSHDLKRVFSAAGIVFKGSGFYINDSRKPSGGGGASTSGSTKKSEPGATTSEPAPAAAPATPPPSGGSGDAAA